MNESDQMALEGGCSGCQNVGCVSLIAWFPRDDGAIVGQRRCRICSMDHLVLDLDQGVL